MESSNGKKNVCVIGAGLSGLYAARCLRKADCQVTVLEARDRVGGRTFTDQTKDHGSVDKGGAYIGPKQNRITRLANELNVKTYDVYHEGKSILNLLSSPMITYTSPNDLGIFWNPFKLLDLNNIIRKIDNLSKEVPVFEPWNSKMAAEWDSTTVQQFIDKNCWTRTAGAAVKIFVRAILCAEPHEVSLLSFLWYIRSGGGFNRLAEVRGGAQEKKIVGGSQQISDLMAKDLEDSVQLNSPVLRVQQNDGCVVITDIHGKSYKADYVISAVPMTLLNKIHFVPPLPDLKQQLVQRMPMGSIIKTVMYYKKPFWREMGMNGIVSSDHGPVVFCLDDTKPDGSHPGLMGFVLADQARELCHLSKDERKKILCEHYAKAFQNKDFLDAEGYEENNWMAEQYSGGCYCAVLPPGVLTKYGKVLREPFGRVHFTGTETATKWAGYMDGALQSGERAAREVLEKLELVVELDGDDEMDCLDYGGGFVENILPSVSQVIRISVGVLFYFTVHWSWRYFVGWRGVLTRKYLDF